VLTFRYGGALLAIAALLVSGQALVQLSLDRQQGDARVVNLAGRQRMLSQRLCMLLLELDGEHRDSAGAELALVADEWERTQDELQRGGPRIAETSSSPAVRSGFEAIAPDQQAMLAAARSALSSSGSRASFARDALAHEEAFLGGMDRIVALYEREASSRVGELRAIELGLLAITLLVLALEALFVFRPAVRELRDYIAQKQAIVKALPDRVVLLAVDGTWIDVRDDSEANVPISFPDGVIDAWLPTARETLATGNLGRVEYRALGNNEACELEGRIVRFSADRVLLVIRDVTDLSRLERQLLQVSDRELVRLSQDLHDGLGQHLVGIASLVKTLRREATGSAHEARVDEIHRLLGEAIAQSRDLARNLSPPVLELDGLAAALRELAAHTERLFGVRCTVVCDQAIELPLPSRAHLHRIAREAVLNAAKHAGATEIEIELRGDGRSWSLAVRDNGIGISAPSGDGMGIHLMQYRAKMLGASLHVARAEDRGTVVSCTLRSVT